MHTYVRLFIEIAQGLIQFPSRLHVEQQNMTANSIAIFVECDASDYGQLIGQSARHVKAFQLILSRAGKRRGTKTHISIKPPPADSPFTTKPNLVRSEDWKHVSDDLDSLISRTLRETMEVKYQFTYFNRDSNAFAVITTEKEMDQELFGAIESVFMAYAKVNGGSIKFDQGARKNL